MARELSIENGFPVRGEGFDKGVLNGQFELVAGIELAAALPLAEMDPVGRAVASALEARGFAECFQRDIRQVALWLGHASLRSTELYLRVDPANKLDILAARQAPNLRKGS